MHTAFEATILETEMTIEKPMGHWSFPVELSELKVKIMNKTQQSGNRFYPEKSAS